MVTGRIQTSSLLGSMVAGFLASACCLGPVLFSLVGLSSMKFFMAFDDYRTELIAAALLLLGIAGYYTYRRTPAQNCAPGSECSRAGSSRLNKAIFWISSALVLGMIFYPEIEKWN